MDSPRPMLLCLWVLALVVAGSTTIASTISVPADHATIQAAIDAAVKGDVVVVATGTYKENIDFRGKAITVRSSDPASPTLVTATIINGVRKGSVVTFRSNETATSVLSGFTITNGSGQSTHPGEHYGGGVFCSASSPMLTNNTITGNVATNGAGLYCWHSSPILANNSINDNSASSAGGGMACYFSSPTINNNVISGNTGTHGGGIKCDYGAPTITNNTIGANHASQGGGGIHLGYASPVISGNTIEGNLASGGLLPNNGGGIDCDQSSPKITGNLITGNSCGTRGGGICCYNNSSPSVVNNTLNGNQTAGKGGNIFYGGGSHPQIGNCIVTNAAMGGGIVTDGSFHSIAYCDVYGNTGGNYVGMADPTGTNGNISTDPLFANAASGDFRLKSTGGHWTRSAWVSDTASSPCIDAGDPASAFVNEPVPNGGRINMGYDGNTADASRSPTSKAAASLPRDAGVAVSGGEPRSGGLTQSANDGSAAGASRSPTPAVVASLPRGTGAAERRGELRSGGLAQGRAVSVPAGELLPVGLVYDLASVGNARFRHDTDPKDAPGYVLPVEDRLRYRHDLYVSVESLRPLATIEAHPPRQLVIIATKQGWVAFRYGEQATVLRTFSTAALVGDLASCEFHRQGTACCGADLPIEFESLNQAVAAQFHPCKACFPAGCPPYEEYSRFRSKREASFRQAMRDYGAAVSGNSSVASSFGSMAAGALHEADRDQGRQWYLLHDGYEIPLGVTGDDEAALRHMRQAVQLSAEAASWAGKAAELSRLGAKDASTYQKTFQEFEDQRRAAFAAALDRTLQQAQKRRNTELVLRLRQCRMLMDGASLPDEEMRRLSLEHDIDYVVACALARDFVPGFALAARATGEARALKYGEADIGDAVSLLRSTMVSSYRDAAREGQTDRALALRQMVAAQKDETLVAATTAADSEVRQSLVTRIQQALDAGAMETVSARLRSAETLYPDEPKLQQLRALYIRTISLRRLEEAKQADAAGDYVAAAKMANEAQRMQGEHRLHEVEAFADLLYGKLIAEATRLEKAQEFDGARKVLSALDGLRLEPDQQSEKAALAGRLDTTPQLLEMMADPTVESSRLAAWCVENKAVQPLVTRARTGNWSPAVHLSALLLSDPAAATDAYGRFLDSIGRCPEVPLAAEESANLQKLALPPELDADGEQRGSLLVHPLRCLLSLSKALDRSAPNTGLAKLFLPRLCPLITSCGALKSGNVQSLCAFAMATAKLPSLAAFHSCAAGERGAPQTHIALSLLLATALQQGDRASTEALTTALEGHLAAESHRVGYPFYVLACAYEALGAADGRRELVEKQKQALADACMDPALRPKTYGTIALDQAGVLLMRECIRDVIAAEGSFLATLPARELPEEAAEWPGLLQQYLLTNKGR